ncbi:hypothetical protein [Clostridium sp. C8-1-8]|uniref:hypothetical protein n=1 Tax=Clostridium sp. C8-1-8 TaxID=2698831 RepID=UPI00137163B0|nr:hypothetical protein [Clostridium sp. C8-1-8]
MIDRYYKIIELLCTYYDIDINQSKDFLRSRENKYMFLLLMKKYDCVRKEELMNILKAKSSRSINYNVKKAEEKFLINKEFRDKYLYVEEEIEKML